MAGVNSEVDNSTSTYIWLWSGFHNFFQQMYLLCLRLLLNFIFFISGFLHQGRPKRKLPAKARAKGSRIKDAHW